MKFTANVTVIGMKRSKGVLENGTAYDSTKVYALTELDDSKGDAKGQFGAEFNLGTSEEYAKYAQLAFPFQAVADMEIVGNGKTSKTVMVALKPVGDKKAA
ncbi:hypothetical protein ACG04R_00930 [Roseateles sp. BYS78W]|uniref:Uncharacterized protein n=1 Tax=Pelomonas candidula TaxID=3299025 RepID=A0ABW7H5N8_9BURK